MIEVASAPTDLATWDHTTFPFYFEVYGETAPYLDMAYAQVLPTGGDTVIPSVTPAIYEYWWTLGHSGQAPEHDHLWPGRPRGHSLWTELTDPAARVYLYFPIHAGWRIEELVATVKYLSPVHNHASWMSAVSEDWSKFQPVLEGAGNLVGKLEPVPGVGLVASGAAPMLSALAKLKLGSVPPSVKGFEWSAGKVTFASREQHGVMQGIVWTLPKVMFEALGGRLTGSVAVSFIPSRSQRTTSDAWTPEPAPLLAHAAVYADHETKWVPGSSEFVELMVSPRVPPSQGPR